MKILNLRFKNLNSLYGEWVIDFTDNHYTSNGIFAIVGPTGSGKSTILDAICLGLYGATPRLKNISKTTNEIMSQKTGECFSEVTFQVKSGIYICHWSQHRARKNSDGNLGESKHEISDFNTKKVLASKKRDVAVIVEEKCGMDMERFTRSILLAQGSFSAFLQASADEKAPILEQITGTDIYSNISIKIHEKVREEGQALSVLTAQNSGIITLSEEDEKLINDELLIIKNKNNIIESKQKEIITFLNWRVYLDSINRELQESSLILNSTLKEKENFRDQETVLDKAIKATELDGDYLILQRVMDQVKSEDLELLGIKKELPNLIEDFENIQKELSNSETQLSLLKEKLKNEKEVIKQVNSYDNQINQNHSLILEKEKDINKLKLKQEEVKRLLNIKDLEINKNSGLLKESQNYIEDNLAINDLAYSMSGIKSDLGILKDLLDKKYFKGIQEGKIKGSLTLLKDEASLLFNTHKTLLVDLKVGEDFYKAEDEKLKFLLEDRSVKNIRDELGYLFREKSLLTKIVSLEQERLELTNGKPCPLCGSTTHPYAEGNTPHLDEVDKKICDLEDLLKEIDSIEVKLKELTESNQKIKNSVVESDKKVLSNKHSNEELENNLKDLCIEIKELDDLINEKKEVLIRLLKSFGVNEFKITEVDSIIKRLEEKVDKFNEKSKKYQELKVLNLEISSQIDTLNKELLLLNSELNEKSSILDGELNSFTLLKSSRFELYGTKNPEIEEDLISKEIIKVESEINNKRVNVEKLSNKRAILESRGILLTNSLNIHNQELQDLNIRFKKELERLGFISIEDYKAYKLPSSEREILLTKRESLDNKISILKSKIEDLKIKQEVEIKRDLTKREIPDLEEEINSLDHSIKELDQNYGALKEKLDSSNNQKIKQRENENKLKKQRVELENWQKLHNLIGSADGKKYRNFVQGLTFEKMIYHANNELIKLSDRYLLIRDEQLPLELNVIDNYQAGEIRSTKNLSGGESFIISLSLALGLSNMASNKVRVDSLFLDEGFGTLDEEALDTALEALSGLHQDGKIIGVISHIPALKERIPTQISISKKAGGRGIISGPGCKFSPSELI